MSLDLAETPQQLRPTADDFGFALAAMGRDGTILYSNPEYYDLVGSDAAAPEVLRGLRSGERAQVDLKDLDPAKSGWALACARAGSFGDETVMWVTLVDVSWTKEKETELQQKIEDLATSNADLEQFAYIASHDLQEPLRMISSYMQLVKQRYSGTLDKDGDEFINFAVDGATRLQTMINDLLVFSRVQTRGKELTDTDSNQALANAMDNLKFNIEDARGKVNHDPLPVVKADATQLTMLFQNLLSNSIKFKKHDVDALVRITCKPSGDFHEFCVEDNGIGLDPQFFDKVFLIFRRLHTRDQYPGTGMGLAVCKRIVARHGGKIWMESMPGMGTKLFFTLQKAEKVQ
jgi:light-regulated signal transduction histidine kinase (bacteriophytochrome)